MKKNHNMLSLMLDPTFKSLHLLSSLIGYEQDKIVVEKYDRSSLYPMLLKCHHHLHLLLESKSGIANQGVHENYNLVIF
jgi:hypothetical protein